MCGGAERVRAQFGHKSFSARSRARKCLILNGEMSEWLKEHAWKACVGETLPWVRIPLSPPDSTVKSYSCVSASSGFPTHAFTRCRPGRSMPSPTLTLQDGVGSRSTDDASHRS